MRPKPKTQSRLQMLTATNYTFWRDALSIHARTLEAADLLDAEYRTPPEPA